MEAGIAMGGIGQEIARQFKSLGTAMTIAMSVVFSTFAGVITGYYLDTWLFDNRTYPWFTLICLGFGLAGGVKNFFILSKRFGVGKGPGEEESREGETGKGRDDSSASDSDR